MRLYFFITALVYSINGFTQYYYNDYLATIESINLHRLYKKNNIKQVNVMSKEADGSLVDGFSITQKVSKNAASIAIESAIKGGSSGISTSYFENGLLIKNESESNGVATITHYTYNPNGVLLTIESATTDTFMNSYTTEMHVWMWNNNVPAKMLKIKNNKDTTIIEFVIDEKGMVAEEVWKKNNKIIETYYYYYNDAGLLTDIVRYNNRVKKMLPDYVFEYNSNKQLIQMIQVQAAATNYKRWVYKYNESGLKTAEACYDKQKQLLGLVEYQYINQ